MLAGCEFVRLQKPGAKPLPPVHRLCKPTSIAQQSTAEQRRQRWFGHSLLCLAVAIVLPCVAIVLLDLPTHTRKQTTKNTGAHLQLLQPLTQLRHEPSSEPPALVHLCLQLLEEALLGCSWTEWPWKRGGHHVMWKPQGGTPAGQPDQQAIKGGPCTDALPCSQPPDMGRTLAMGMQRFAHQSRGGRPLAAPSAKSCAARSW